MAMSQLELDELVGRISNLYTRNNLSPPFHLHAAAKHWLGLSAEEIVATVEAHLREHRRAYTSGSGDTLFSLVEAAIRKLWRDAHGIPTSR